MSTFENAAPAPRGLLYFATFNANERAAIAALPELRDAIRASAPAEWSGIVDRHQAAQREGLRGKTLPRPVGPSSHERDRQWRYVQSILSRELRALAAMQPGSGRNDTAFRLVCRVGRWAHHGVITRDQLITDVLDACERNGLVRDDGRKAVFDTIASALARSAADSLPQLGARHG
jgi:hypothetical protein